MDSGRPETSRATAPKVTLDGRLWAPLDKGRLSWHPLAGGLHGVHIPNGGVGFPCDLVGFQVAIPAGVAVQGQDAAPDPPGDGSGERS